MKTEIKEKLSTRWLRRRTEVGFIEHKVVSHFESLGHTIKVVDVSIGRAISDKETTSSVAVKLGIRLARFTSSDEGAKDAKMSKVWDNTSPSAWGTANAAMIQSILEIHRMKKGDTPKDRA
jgi:hypothetical protein